MHDSNDVTARPAPPLLHGCRQVHCRRPTHQQSLVFDQVVSHVQRFLVTHLKGIVNQGSLEVGSWSIQPNPLHHCVKRVPQTMSLLLLAREQHVELDLVEQAGTLGVSQHHSDILPLLL